MCDGLLAKHPVLRSGTVFERFEQFEQLEQLEHCSKKRNLSADEHVRRLYDE